jgi:hypothetical protein
VHTATITCLWYSVFGSRPVQVVLLREPGHHGYQLALVFTDTTATATPAQIIGRCAARWSIEVAIEDAKQLFGVGQARNRLAAAVRRTVPFADTGRNPHPPPPGTPMPHNRESRGILWQPPDNESECPPCHDAST